MEEINKRGTQRNVARSGSRIGRRCEMGNNIQLGNTAEISGRKDIRHRHRMLAYARGYRNIRRAQGCIKK